jgi:HPt (histidine-containing phosphotransfer) domain-containing protein
VNGNADMLQRFLRMFRERNANGVSEIGAALAARDLPTARRLVHSLKGGAGTIGLMELHAEAARLEELLAEELTEMRAEVLADPPGNHDPARRDEAFAALQAASTRAMQALAEILDTPDPP